MKRYIKILISCAFLSVSWMAEQLSWPFRGKAAPSLVILYYHGVPSGQRAHFARQMDFLQRHAAIVPADWCGGSIKGRVCAITFDDALTSTVVNALPELRARSIPCTIFVPSGVMGRMPDWEMEQGVADDDSVADSQTIREIASPLITIGSHTVSHCHLSRLPRDDVRREIGRSRETLSNLLGQEIDTISFPYGSYSADVLDVCIEAGYRIMYTIDPVPVDVRAHSQVRGRVSVSPDDPLVEVYLKCAGAYRWMPIASAIKRWIKQDLFAARPKLAPKASQRPIS